MKTVQQTDLFGEPICSFPSTRYQGSKSKFIDWIWDCLSGLEFETVLDAFGGTGCFAYAAKKHGKSVQYNDILTFNAIIGKALIENQGETLDENDLSQILDFSHHEHIPTFISDTFHDIYYTDEENLWLDNILYNIRSMKDEYKQSLAYFAVFQSCITKRPYNLFHRKNLYVRLQDVKRSFGNKKTWDTPFETHFRKFVGEANRSAFDNNKTCRSSCADAASLVGSYDLVYIDTPYVSDDGKGTDYAGFYHFLDGMVEYDKWKDEIDYSSPHRKLMTHQTPWTSPTEITNAFSSLIRHFSDSTLVISYRNDGIPSIEWLVDTLKSYGKDVTVFQSDNMKYVLSNKTTREMLLVAK